MPLSPSIKAADGRSLTTRIFGFGIDAAGADAAHIERQADHAMGVAAAQIGFDHQARQRFRIRRRQAGRRRRRGR